MSWPDEKTIAISALLIIALAVVFTTSEKGLDVIINIVCAIGGMVTGAALTKL